MNKLIVLVNLSGSYKGGAQRRYINLFKELQKTRDDYYLLINKSLYKSCSADGIFDSNKNIIVLPVKFERYSHNIKNSHLFSNKSSKSPNIFRSFLGGNKYFLKQLFSWILYNIDLYGILGKYEIKTIYGIFTGGIWSWTLAKLLRIRFIYSYNDSVVSMISQKWINFLSSEYWPLKYATKVDFLSNDILKSLQHKTGYFDNEKVLITPNSFIDYIRFFPVYPKKELITFLSRMDLSSTGVSFKNPELLLEAIYILQQQYATRYKYIFIGDGILIPVLKQKALEWELENVDFIGGLAYPENILKESSIFISLQKDNNYPSQSLIEAMACGNAIIASDVGETRKLVTEDEGILVPLNAEKIADAIRFLSNNPEECERLGKNARKKVLTEQSMGKYIEYFLGITKR